MTITVPFGNEQRTIVVDIPPDQILVARGKNPTTTQTWRDVVAQAVREPVGVPPIHAEKLSGKKVVIITDDWGRPTPAYEVIPVILRELEGTGVAKQDITFITASGMHDPMPRDDLVRKLGAETVESYRSIVHDGGAWDDLVLAGISRQGTPIWVSRYVAEANYTIGLGRIYLHESHGYEGGYKLILPGVSGFDTIARDHSFNFSPDSITGVLDNPSRRETDEVGKAVGIDFLINVVVNARSQPIKAFCGEPMTVHHLGIDYGEREVWGGEVGEQADLVIGSSGSTAPKAGYNLDHLYRAARVTKEGGTVIFLVSENLEFDATEGDGVADDGALARLDLKEFGKALATLSFPEIIRLHEKRNWPMDERAIQWRMKSLRGEYYRRRRIRETALRNVILARDPDPVVREVTSKADRSRLRVIVLPELATTLPKEQLFRVAGAPVRRPHPRAT